MDAIKTALDGARDYLSTHVEEAHYTDSTATAVADSSLKVDISGPNGERLTSDFPASVGGTGSAPSPGWYLRAAQASCVAALVVMRAASLGLGAIHVEVTVDSVSDDRGILGMDEDAPAGPESTRIRIVLSSSGGGSATSAKALEDIATWAIEHCPVVDALMREIPLEVIVETS